MTQTHSHKRGRVVGILLELPSASGRPPIERPADKQVVYERFGYPLRGNWSLTPISALFLPHISAFISRRLSGDFAPSFSARIWWRWWPRICL